MTTLVPRPPYTQEELDRLYPKQLKLQLVQVLLRHGERSPVSARFQNAGLAPFWPYCSSARQLTSAIMATSSKPASWSALSWRRRLETFGHNDASVLASGPSDGSMDNVCNLGELTDQGRYTTLTLGERLRHLYVEQLGFMPKILESADSVYLRATPMPRALESVQQAFWGMYPLSARTASFPPATIVTRTPQDETLFPNDANCRRFGQLLRAFGARTAERWNDTPDMEYLSSKISKWMPDQAPVRVDSHPRLSGIMDTVNSTLAHGPETRLPKEFYDDRAREIIETIGVEEWFSGYKESNEYRTVGIGALAGDIVARMVGSVEHSGNDGLLEVGGRDGEMGQGRAGEKGIRFGLSGCHDTTLAALLSSLGAFEGEKWPPYTSSIAFELFKKEGGGGGVGVGNVELDRPMTAMRSGEQRESGWLTWFGSAGKKKVGSEGIARKNIEEMNQGEREALGGFFVRVRYNDRAVTIPGCKTYGRHLEGDETFCTLDAFKAVVDKFTPKNWKQACSMNLDQPPLPTKAEPAGYVDEKI